MDDVTLLLIEGLPPTELANRIDRQGLAFQTGPEFEENLIKFGASREIIEALNHATIRSQTALSERNGSDLQRNSPEPMPNNPLLTTLTPAGGNSSASPMEAPGGNVMSEIESQKIIREFTTKETKFKKIRKNYTYRQVNKVETLDEHGAVDGTYSEEWDIVYKDNGSRFERTLHTRNTLHRITLTDQDLERMRQTEPFVLDSDSVSQYSLQYLRQVALEGRQTYLFSVRPKEIKSPYQYFEGIAWVDAQDLQIVQVQGKAVPESRSIKGENLFPRFTTFRERIDGKYWFPTRTVADDVLEFSHEPVHVRETFEYTEYKLFSVNSCMILDGKCVGKD